MAVLDWLAQLGFKDWIGAAGAVAAVCGTIVAIVLPRRTSRKQSDLQYFTEYARRYQDLASLAPQDMRDPNFSLVGRPDYDRILRVAHAYLDMCFEQWYLNQQGLISSKLWLMWKSGIEAGFSRPALQQAWNIVRVDRKCNNDFAAFVDRLCRRGSSSIERPR
jgi:hypothetical protein